MDGDDMSQGDNTGISGGPLLNLPAEILAHIAFFTAVAAQPRVPLHLRPSLLHPQRSLSIPELSYEEADSYTATPPVALRNLVVTCRHTRKHLSLESNPGLYARVFKAKFDTAAVARRYGKEAVSSKVLAEELVKRCTVLKRIRTAGLLRRFKPEPTPELAEANMRENLWTAFLMLTENDGENTLALRWANLRFYLAMHHSLMLESAVQPGYPPDTEDRALAMHLRYLMTDPAEYGADSREEADEKLFVLRPFVFACHKFDCFYAPWTLRQLPIRGGLDGTASQENESQSSHGAGRSFLQRTGENWDDAPQPILQPDSSRPRPPDNPFLADLTPRSRGTVVTHFGQQMQIRAPTLVHAAYFNFFLQVERDPAIVGLSTTLGNPGRAGGQDAAEGAQPSGVAAQATEATAPVAVVQREPPTTLGSLHSEPLPDRNRAALAGTNVAVNGPLALRSADHDRDLARLLACHDPFSSPGLRPTFFAGAFEGAWEGRFSFFDFDSYREMLAGRMASLYQGPFGEQPQVWKIKEHFVRVGSRSNSRRIAGGDGTIINAGFSSDEPFEETTKLPRSLAEAKDVARERGQGKRMGTPLTSGRYDRSRLGTSPALTSSMAHAHLNVSDTAPDDIHLYPEFSAEDGGPRAGIGRLPSRSSPAGKAAYTQSSHASSSKTSAGTGQATGEEHGEEHDEDDGDDDDDDAQYEMLVSGMGHSAWGRFVIRGRVRAWDGMLIISKEYRPDGRGRWLYRGYVVAGKALVGRWRDSFTPADMSGYEGPFILNQRSKDATAVPAAEAGPVASTSTRAVGAQT